MARKMKDSGIEWIGEIPEGWEVVPVKRLCTMQAGKNLTSEQIAPEGTYPVYGGNGIRGFFSDYNCDGKFLTVGRQGALCGNVHKINGKVWATEHAVITTPSSYTILDFLYFLLIGMDLNQYVSSTAAQPGLAVGTLLNLKTCYPCSTLEQAQISNYLNAKCSEIDVTLSKIRSSIDEYKKLKQAVITQAVTEGTPSMFSSPHSVKLKYLISIVSGEAIRNEQLSDFGEYPVYGGGEIIGFCSQYNTSEGSLIIGRVGARCGCVTHTTCKSWATDNALIVLPTCNAKYMYYVIGHCQLNNLNTSNAQPLITSTKIKNVVVPYFSDAMQQQEIADYLDAKCAEIDGLIAKKEQLVKELESYKKSLIYEVVTGKREV